MSKSYSTFVSNKTETPFLYPNKMAKNKKNINDIAIEECKKLYSKNCIKANPYVINQLKKDKLNIYLNNLKTKDLAIINKLLTKYFYFKHIELSPFDPEKEDCSKKRKARLKEIPSTTKEFSKLNKPKSALEKEKSQNILKIIMGISRYLSLSDNIISLSLNSIMISKDSAKYLAQGLLDNKTIQGLNINYCIISLEAYELFLKSLLKHEAIEYLDLSNNNFSDKYGEMIALIISSQTLRRDQIIWASGLRNDFPSINEYSRGLVSINLRGNKLGKYSADCISKALSHDQYIRIIDLSENNLDNAACKKFIHMMRKNNILLTIDLRDNPGYDESIYQRMIMKMSKNIRYLYQQFQNGNYSEEEFENLKDFIDISFFDVDIPQEIVDYYNGNIQDTLEESGEEKQINNKLPLGGDLNVMNDIQERAEEEEDDGTIKTNQEPGEASNKKTEEENKKLLEENMKLKQQISELKLQKNELENKNSKIKKTNNKMISKPEDPNNIEENYTYIIDLINELNDVMNNIENLKKKKEKNQKLNQKNEKLEKNKEDNYLNNEEFNEQENNNIINNNKNDEIIQNPKQLENGNYINQNPNPDIEENSNQIQNQQQHNEEEKYQQFKPEEQYDNQEKNQEQEHEPEIEEGQINFQNQDLKNEEENIENEQVKNNNNNMKENEQEIENVQNNNDNNNNINNTMKELENKNKNSQQNGEEKNVGEEGINAGGEEGMEEGENEDEEINLDDLTEEEKMALFQQQEILQKMQEEAEARGEHFDVQEYLAMLEKQANEEEEEGDEEGENKGSDKINKSF